MKLETPITPAPRLNEASFNASIYPVTSLTPQPTSLPHSELTRSFTVNFEGRDVGYISRGHVMIYPEFRLRGIFGSALARLEEYERALFAAGKFEAYKREILRAIGTPAGDADSVIRRLTKPQHIDFWRLPSVAGEYLRCGYSLDGYSKEVLVHRGYVTRDANERELSFALRKNHAQLRGYILCVLTKSA